MRIIVMSDTHKMYSSLEKIVTSNIEADMFIHLGDGEEEINLLLAKFPEIAPKFYHVCGNCDSRSLSPDMLILEVEGHKILAAHGHLLGVAFSLATITRKAEENGCDIILYGHTHQRFNKYIDEMYIMNPGSASSPRDGNKRSYGYIDIIPSGIVTNIIDL